MAEYLIEVNAPNGSYSAAQTTALGARSALIYNRGSVPVMVSNDGTNETVRLQAAGEKGSIRVLQFQPSQAPLAWYAQGIGGTAETVIEASTEARYNTSIAP